MYIYAFYYCSLNGDVVINSRYLERYIKDDLTHGMVFIGGPRQVGKTTLAKSFINDKAYYFNYDHLEDKKVIINRLFPADGNFFVLDEIHKYRLWRGLLKGIYDKEFPEKNFLVTGSARLDHFRKGGDSLLGRYHYHRLHPFTAGELTNGSPKKDAVELLLQFGGFPQPLFKQETRFLKRWHNERIARVIKEDIRDLSQIREISNLEILVELLFSRIAGLLSIKSLSEDLQVSPHTIDNYLSIFDNTYLTYRLSPFAKDQTKNLKKTQKIYFWDWSMLEGDEKKGERFENMVASHLLKFCHFQYDVNGEKMNLHYVRDVEKREVDFIVVNNKKPLFLVECKLSERQLSPALTYYKNKFKVPKAYQVHLGNDDYDVGDENKHGRVLPFAKFTQIENLP